MLAVSLSKPSIFFGFAPFGDSINPKNPRFLHLLEPLSDSSPPTPSCPGNRSWSPTIAHQRCELRRLPSADSSSRSATSAAAKAEKQRPRCVWICLGVKELAEEMFLLIFLGEENHFIEEVVHGQSLRLRKGPSTLKTPTKQRPSYVVFRCVGDSWGCAFF